MQLVALDGALEALGGAIFFGFLITERYIATGYNRDAGLWDYTLKRNDLDYATMTLEKLILGSIRSWCVVYTP